jgi:hypothetical protein
VGGSERLSQGCKFLLLFSGLRLPFAPPCAILLSPCGGFALALAGEAAMLLREAPPTRLRRGLRLPGRLCGFPFIASGGIIRFPTGAPPPAPPVVAFVGGPSSVLSALFYGLMQALHFSDWLPARRGGGGESLPSDSAHLLLFLLPLQGVTGFWRRAGAPARARKRNPARAADDQPLEPWPSRGQLLGTRWRLITSPSRSFRPRPLGMDPPGDIAVGSLEPWSWVSAGGLLVFHAAGIADSGIIAALPDRVRLPPRGTHSSAARVYGLAV